MRTTTTLTLLASLLAAVPAASQNLLTNGDFATDLSGWETPPLLPQEWSPRDAGGSSSSGSAKITTTRGQGTGDDIFQCVPVTGATSYTARARALVEPQSEPGEAFLNLNFYSGEGCADPDFLSGAGALDSTSPQLRDAWDTLETSVVAPASARSARYSLSAHKQTGAMVGTPFVVFVDDAFLVAGEQGSCIPGPTTLCLNQDGRFQAEVSWRDATGASGPGQAVEIGKRDSGLFYFFDSENIEMLVKVLDACGLPGFESYWVFYAATTSVEFTLTITDTLTDEVREYTNPLGRAAEPVQDTAAFATCP